MVLVEHDTAIAILTDDTDQVDDGVHACARFQTRVRVEHVTGDDVETLGGADGVLGFGAYEKPYVVPRRFQRLTQPAADKTRSACK
jgi:hypothetical protein